MAVNLLVHDTRLPGRTPVSVASFQSFEVGETTRLDDFLARCVSIADSNGGITNLYLMAHGAEMEFAGHVGGGYGIMFCQEFVLLDNVGRFSALAEKVDHIILLVCSAAAVSTTFRRIDITRPELSRTYHGDGNELCRQMAISAECRVTAARELQAYATADECTTFAGYELFCSPGYIDFGEWEGSVVTYDERGNIISETTNPSAWRDSAGVIHDPRVDPAR